MSRTEDRDLGIETTEIEGRRIVRPDPSWLEHLLERPLDTFTPEPPPPLPRWAARAAPYVAALAAGQALCFGPPLALLGLWASVSWAWGVVDGGIAFQEFYFAVSDVPIRRVFACVAAVGVIVGAALWPEKEADDHA